jgi:ABC-2 type transport system ATP-binding protein
VSDAETKAADLLDKFQLSSKRNAMAGDLSRGMRQKLAVCCAYLHDPDVILFDEPLTGLDPHGIRVLKKSIVERAERGKAIIVSSHLLAMVEDICSHVLILRTGENRFFGTIGELRLHFSKVCHTASLEEIFFHATNDEDDGSTRSTWTSDPMMA